jgi:hypothetical protein
MLSEILRLGSLIADCLSETQKLKSSVVSLQQYEYAAQIRDFEKQFEKIKDSLSRLSYPIIPSKGLTRNGTIYSSQLFSYGHSRSWKNLPDYIHNLFMARRNELNDLMQYFDTTTDYFAQFNARLRVEESRIDKFINSLMLVYQAKSLESIIDDFSYGGIILQFLTSKEFTRSPRKEGVAKWSLYEIEIPIDDWIAKSKAYYEIMDTNNDLFLKLLPIVLRDEKICHLFYYLASNGMLALQDMLNIDQVLVSFPFLCRLKRI